jgi:serine/threonine protein kinase/formylglycine-generating enzyme required for sulfatase activity
MTRGHHEPQESHTLGLFSSHDAGAEATDRQATSSTLDSDADSAVEGLASSADAHSTLDSDADSAVGGLASSADAGAHSPYITASEAGAGPEPFDMSEVGDSLFDGPIEPGRVLFNRYEVLREIDRGGMGVVWLVRHLELDAERVLKFIRPGFTIHDTIRVRFQREAKITAKFTHPNIVVVHDARLTGNSAYFEMEYVRGQSLNKLLRPGVPMPLEWIGRILDQLCDALQVAHDNQVVHRDLKPSNLMLVEGRPPGKEFLKVLDFGIAKILDSDNKDSGGRTMTEGFLGTVHYASPEQLLGRPVDGRSDIYATGVLLYEMLSGFRPFGGTAMEQMHGHAYLPPPPMADKNPQAHVRPELERLVMRCLAKDPAGRPESPRALAEEFLALDRAGVVSPSHSRIGAPVYRVDPHAPTEPIAGSPSEVETERTTPLVGPRPGPGPITGTPTWQSPQADPLTDQRPKPGLERSRWRRHPVRVALTLLAVLVVVMIYAARKSVVIIPPSPTPVPSPFPRSLDPAARVALSRWQVEAYQPGDLADLVAGWPRALVRTGEGTEFVRFKEDIYLPKGYEPETTAGDAEDGWPAVLVRPVSADQVLRFLRIPGGSFPMGKVTDANGRPVDPEAPARPVALSGFYMMPLEVTNGQVEAYYESRKIPPEQRPTPWRDSFEALVLDVGRDLARQHPAVRLSHRDAEAFALWANGLLPTEAQWEYAARSRGQDRRYVEGIDDQVQPVTQQANIWTAGNGLLPTVPDGKDYPKDRTGQGIFNMTGNVREWCRDVWEPFVPAREPLVDHVGPPRTPEALYVIRGGSFITRVDRGSTIARTDREPADQTAKDLGFRLVIECPSSSRSAASVALTR